MQASNPHTSTQDTRLVKLQYNLQGTREGESYGQDMNCRFRGGFSVKLACPKVQRLDTQQNATAAALHAFRKVLGVVLHTSEPKLCFGLS